MGGAGCVPYACRAMILALVLLVVPLAFAAEGKDLEQERYYGQLKVKTTVFNAFPNRNTSAFVLFEEDRISRLAYGEMAVKVASLEKHADFLIQFKTVPKEEVVGDYTDFGFMEGELAEDMEVVMIITRGKEDSKKPGHQLLTFPRDVEPDFSKLYIYNGVWDAKMEGKGLNFYGLYKRKNYDGSDSESITQLAMNVLMNEGREIDLAPETKMLIKGFYVTIKAVSEFKLTTPVVALDDYVAVPGKRSYLVAYGNWKDTTLPPSAVVLESRVNSASSLYNTLPCIVCLWALCIVFNLLP